MKLALLFSLLLPLQFFGQVQNDAILPKYIARPDKIKSIRATTVFITARDNDKPDTGAVTIEEYDINGNIAKCDYHNTLDKNDYKSNAEYFYKNSGQQQVIVHYEKGIITDSIVSFSSGSYIYYFPGSKKYVIHEIKDSVLTETAISGADTIIHKHKIGTRGENRYEDDFYPGVYEKEIIMHDSIHSIDTCIFFGKNGEKILTIVNAYDDLNHLLKSDYYNQKDKDYRIYVMRFNTKEKMVFYMPVDEAHRTYQILREYNEHGMVAKETRISSAKKDPVIVTYYEYSYYKK